MLKFRAGIGFILTIILLGGVGIYYLIQRPQPTNVLSDLLAETPPPPPNDLFVGDEILPPIPAPEFDLINYTGERITNDDLKGMVVLLSFAYTSCPDTCPVIFGRYQSLQQDLGDAMGADVALVFLTVDPEVDTPERLSAHVSAMGGQWYYLTEDLETMQAVWEDFKMFVEKDDPLVSHSNLTYLIDAQGLVRVQYLGMPPANIFLSDIHKILNGE